MIGLLLAGRPGRGWRVVSGLLLLAAALPRALAGPPVGETAGSARPDAWLVRFDAAADGAARARGAAMVRALGGRVRYRLEGGALLAVRNLPAAAAERLALLPGVARVVREERVSADMFHSVPVIGALQSELAAAGVASRGSGIRVCVLDTGVDPNHLLLAGRVDVATGFDFANEDAEAIDDQGHGSHVAGVIAATDAYLVNGLPYSGVAPSAIIVPVKVLDAQGNGDAADVIAGLDYCSGLPVTLSDTSTVAIGKPVDVINVSLSTQRLYNGFCDDEEIAVAANAAVARGVVVVGSTGNASRANAIGSPACGTDVIAVGATYDQAGLSFSFQGCNDSNTQVDEIVCTSNGGTAIDLTAPGCQTHSVAAGSGVALTPRCGTSQAAAHVSGVAALAFGRDACITPAALAQALASSAVDRGSAGFDSTYGWGRIDAAGTLAALAAAGSGNDSLAVSGTGATIVTFDPVPGAATYDILRGSLGSLAPGSGSVDLGAVLCLENDSPDGTTGPAGPSGHADMQTPAAGTGFFYLFRAAPAGAGAAWGADSLCRPRVASIGDCP